MRKRKTYTRFLAVILGAVILFSNGTISSAAKLIDYETVLSESDTSPDSYSILDTYSEEINLPEEVKDKVYDETDNVVYNVSREEISATNINKKDKRASDVADKTIVVAVLDTGINKGEEIFDNKLIEGKNFVSDYGMENDTTDSNGHGTAMARIVLDGLSDTPYKNCVRIMPIKVLNDEGKGNTLTAYKGINYIIEEKKKNQNVDYVINLSMSGVGKSKLLESAINEARDNNIPVVVSAGNNNSEVIDYTPANIGNAVTVGSSEVNIDEYGDTFYSKSIYSNYGRDTYGIDYTTNGHYEYKRNINGKEVITEVEGTSVSAAYVTSYIALLKSMADYDLSINDIYDSLRESAIKLDEKGYVTEDCSRTDSFGNGYLKKDNIKLLDGKSKTENISDEYDSQHEKIQSEDTQPDKPFSDEDENIELEKNEHRICCAFIVDNTGFYNGSDSNCFDVANKLNSATGKKITFSENCENKTNLFVKLGTYLKDGNNHYIAFNNNVTYEGGEQITFKGTKTIHCVDTDSYPSEGICIVEGKRTNELVTISNGANITFKNGQIFSDISQESTNYSYINSDRQGLRPALVNNGTVVLDNTGLRAGNNASCVAKNNGTMTLKGGGASIGAARPNGSRRPNIINNKSKTLNIQGNYQLDKSHDLSKSKCNSESVENLGIVNISGSASIGHATIGINNSGSSACTMSGGTILGCDNGIENAGGKTFNFSGGTIASNVTGILNKGTFNISGGDIRDNLSYGINNSGTISHSGGSIHSNKGVKPDSTDKDDVGVYQNGTYNISGSASVTDNSIYLVSKAKKVNQSGTFKGSSCLTTSKDDRQIGRELVTGSSGNYSKYSLSYGDYNGKQSARYVTDSSEEGSCNFSGSKVAIRPGNLNNKTSDSCYLSGEYELSYLPNNPKGTSVSPSSYTPTSFYWNEQFKARFGSNTYSVGDNYDFIGYSSDKNATSAEYNNDTNIRYTGNRKFYGIWEEVKGTYNVNYIHNNGYGDENIVTAKLDTCYTYQEAPSRYNSSTITFNTEGGDDITSVNGALLTGNANLFRLKKSFDGWSKQGSLVKYKSPSTFINLAKKDETIKLNGNWSVDSFKLPYATKDDYELVGWKAPDNNKIIPAGTTYTPTGDYPITFTAVWKEIERTVTFDPNGATDSYGNKVSVITEDKTTPVSVPVTLPVGSDIGGVKLSEDVTYVEGYVNNSVTPDMPESIKGNLLQYRAKKGDIVNSLGSKNTLSVFRGWSKEKTGGTTYNGQVVLSDPTLYGDSAGKMSHFTFYAIWDKFPDITTKEITIESTSSITKSMLTDAVKATDTEDGNITDNIQVVNYNEIVNAFNKGSSAYTVIYEVTDSAGNTTRAFAKIKIKSTYDGKALNVITRMVRSINRHAYNTYDAKRGGCLDNSPWYNDPAYVDVMTSGFDNMDNNTPISSYKLTKEERDEILNHMHDIGLSHMHDRDVLQYYVDHYMDSSHKNQNFEEKDYTVPFFTFNRDDYKKREEKELDRQKLLRNDMDLSRVYV